MTERKPAGRSFIDTNADAGGMAEPMIRPEIPADIPAISTDAARPCLRVAIVGGGASGTVVAGSLLRAATAPVEIVIFERRERLGEGVAYSTTDPLHLLNVPACGMSALPEEPDHFRRWAGVGETDFVPRMRYAVYLREVLDESRAGAVEGCSLTHLRQEVVDVERGSAGGVESGGERGVGCVVTTADGACCSFDAAVVITADGTRIAFDAVVLATGNDAPFVPASIGAAGLPASRLIVDPWVQGALDGVGDGERVLIVGTGLTFVDVALTLLTARRDVRIDAVSRHGLVPQAHEDPWRPRHPAPALDPTRVTLRDLVAFVRQFGEDWRRGLDALRPLTPALWQAMDARTRGIFVRRLSRYWDVHRHRMAPRVARALDDALGEERVRIHAATVASVTDQGDCLAVTLSDKSRVNVDRVIACTGPAGDARGSRLGRRLVKSGHGQVGPMGLGYLVDGVSGALIGASGVAEAPVYTVGPPRRGVLWETTAMPEIRVQAAEVARVILERHQPANASPFG